MDQIRENAFREEMEVGVTFINRKLIAAWLRRSERWVTKRLTRIIKNIKTEFGEGHPGKM